MKKRDRFGKLKRPSVCLASFKMAQMSGLIDPQESWHRFNGKYRRKKHIRKAQRRMHKRVRREW